MIRLNGKFIIADRKYLGFATFFNDRWMVKFRCHGGIELRIADCKTRREARKVSNKLNDILGLAEFSNFYPKLRQTILNSKTKSAQPHRG